MRDEFDDQDYTSGENARQGLRSRFAARASTWIGALLALAVIGGLALWGYRLTQRDASTIPVIRASLEPAKIQPDTPGGTRIAHQDITSYSAGDGESGSSRITLAEPPQSPTDADVPMGALQDGGSATALVMTTQTDAGPPAEPAEAAGIGTALAPSVSPAAPVRPANLSQRMSVARQLDTSEAELAARAAASAVQVQLGAFPDQSVTRSEWTRIYQLNEDILSGRTLVVQSTISGGRRFFRLRVGPFKDRVEAQNVCRALQARGQDCLVAVNG